MATKTDVTDLPQGLAEAFRLAGDRLAGLGRTIVYFPRIGSTNDVALRLASGPDADGTIVIADAQTAGRGRRGRSWFSPPGAGLYVSLVLAFDPKQADADRGSRLVTLTAAVALAEAIEAVTGLRPEIKWPNDLLIDRRKVCGILAETFSSPAMAGVVLGYGINVVHMGHVHCPPELAGRVSSLESELGRPVDRDALCVETVAAVGRRRADLMAGRFDAILDAWCVRAPGSRGTRVTWRTPSGSVSGITEGIDDRGALMVRVDNRVESIVAGDVEFTKD